MYALRYYMMFTAAWMTGYGTLYDVCVISRGDGIVITINKYRLLQMCYAVHTTPSHHCNLNIIIFIDPLLEYTPLLILLTSYTRHLFNIYHQNNYALAMFRVVIPLSRSSVCSASLLCHQDFQTAGSIKPIHLPWSISHWNHLNGLLLIWLHSDSMYHLYNNVWTPFWNFLKFYSL